MSNVLEQRLREYGTTIDTATADDLVHRDAPAVEPDLDRVAHRPRRPVAVLVVLALAGIAAAGVVAVAHRPHTAETAPPSTTPSTTCSSAPVTRRRACNSQRPRTSQPRFSNLGSGADGSPTPAQAAALAAELREYDPAEVQSVVAPAIRNGNYPADPGAADQATVAALEFRYACRRLLVAATAAESAPAGQVASVVKGIINPEVHRLIARTPAGSSSYKMFQRYGQKIIAGQAPEVIQSFGTSLCMYETPIYWKGLEAHPSG